MTNGKPDKIFRIQRINVPENFNEDKEMLIDLLEHAFTDFVVQVKDTILYIFKIIINRERLSKNICINYIPID